MIVHARTSHKHTQKFSASIAMLRGVAGVVAALSAAGASAAAADEARLVAVAQTHKTVAERHAAVPAGPALRLTSDAPPVWFLERARSSIQAHRINVAKEALERAETRLLDDRASALPLRSDVVDHAVLDAGVARRALSVGDRARALYAIDDALAALTVSASVAPSNDAAVPAGSAGAPAPMPAAATRLPPLPPPPPPPVRTFVLLPGHWRLDGSTYVWVRGDNALRPVEPRRFVQGHWLWRDRVWMWVSDHYE